MSPPGFACRRDTLPASPRDQREFNLFGLRLPRQRHELERGCVSRITQNDQIGLLEPRGGDMRLVTGVLASVLLLAGVGASHAVVRIADDRGGGIGTYVDRYQGLRSSGETVVIDGLCASACTIVLGAVPHDKICVTSRATLGTHTTQDSESIDQCPSRFQMTASAAISSS
jgi:hypothetical protein